MVFIRWSLPIFLFVVLSPAFAQQTNGGLNELRESLERQDARIRRMQVLLAEQNARQDGIEQSQPPLDLIESLYAELNQMQEELQNLQPRIKGLEEQLEQQNEGILEARKEPLKLGMLALMAGNPDSAAEYFKPFLAEEAEPKIRNNLMMALANSYLAQGFAEQAASYYGTVIGLPEKGRHYPLALFSLGKAFELLGEIQKRDVVWRELEVNFSEHPLTFQAQLSQKKTMKEQISEGLSGNLELTEKSEKASVLEN